MKLVGRVVAAAGVLVVPLLLAGCGDDAAAGSAPRIVASFYPLQYVAERVAGHRADVVNLTQPGQEPHDLELSLRATGDLTQADLVVYEKGFQSAVDEAVAEASPDHVVDAADVVGLRDGDDPHIWLNPANLVRIARSVAGELAEVDAAHEGEYADNLAFLVKELETLERDYDTGLRECATRTVVVSHDAFRQLRAFGLEPVAISGLSPDAEPSPAHLRRLHDLIESDHITTVFSEELASPAMAEALASDLGLRTAVLDPIEGLSDDTADEDYVSLMRKNLEALREANDCT